MQELNFLSKRHICVKDVTKQQKTYYSFPLLVCYTVADRNKCGFLSHLQKNSLLSYIFVFDVKSNNNKKTVKWP